MPTPPSLLSERDFPKRKRDTFDDLSEMQFGRAFPASLCSGQVPIQHANPSLSRFAGEARLPISSVPPKVTYIFYLHAC